MLKKITKQLVLPALFAMAAPWAFAQNKTASDSDPYLTKLYDQLHSSPMQERFKKLAPMPTGVVYLQRPGDGEKEMRAEFRAMKKLGFNCLKQIMVGPGWTIEQVQKIALEEGIIPFWYGEAGWDEITPELLKTLKIPANLPMKEIKKHPAMIKYQNGVLLKRIERIEEYIKNSPNKQFIRDRSSAFEPELGGRGFDLNDEGKKQFALWCKKTYGTIEKLNQAWNQYHVGLTPKEGPKFTSWEDFDARWQQIGPNEYRHLRDILRFKIEHSRETIMGRMKELRAFDKNAIFRGGGEMGLFLPQAWWGVDMSEIADAITDYGSFYPSMHFAWHYDEVDHELTRPFYMQSSLARDFFKGGWAATWESTGGPQQFSGGKGGNGFTVDDGVMSQFILSNFAAGYRGFGLWTWNARTAGWETGEYALLDRNDKVGKRAEAVGKMARALQDNAEDIWQTRKEPLVGVLWDWENEALWGAMSQANRDKFRMDPVNARVGVSRALINANVPFEYVLAKDIQKGLAGRYKVIYLPAMLCLQTTVMEKLHEYVKQGGRVILDLPGGWFNENYAINYTGKGTLFEKTFGATLDDYQFAGVNMPWTLGKDTLQGFTADLTPTSGKVLEKYGTGAPAIIENKVGKGSAVLMGYEAATACFKPKQTKWEQKLIKHTLGELKSPIETQNGVIAYRLAGPTFDYYVLVNDGEETSTTLKTSYSYSDALDCVSGEKLSATASIKIPRYSARWLKFNKK